MAKYTKPSYAEQWASAGDKVAPDATKIQTGHIVEKPNYEYMNWIQNRQDVGISYSLQMGIVEWDNSTEYQYSSSNWSSYVQRNGVVYKSIQTGTNKDPLTETAYWSIAFDDKGSAATVQTNLTTHITNYGTLTGLTNAATARTNLDVYSKAEAAEKNGDDAQLFEAADGTTGKEVVNKSQLDTKADKNGNSGETFSVATATTSAHAIRKDQFDAKTGIATDTVAGISRFATNSEVVAGVLDSVGVNPLNLLNAFTSVGRQTLNATQGQQVFVGGLILKWGNSSEVVAGDITITFTTAFPNECFGLIAIPKVAIPLDYDSTTVQSVSASSVVLNRVAGGVAGAYDVFWLAVGN